MSTIEILSDRTKRILEIFTPDAIKVEEIQGLMNYIKRKVSEQGFCDVSLGMEVVMNTTRDMKNAAIILLKKEGYEEIYYKNNGISYFLVVQSNRPYTIEDIEGLLIAEGYRIV